MASAWFEGADPFMQVFFDPRRYSRAGAERKFRALWKSIVTDMWHGADWGDETKAEFFDSADNWSGLFLESIDLFRLSPSEEEELLDQGYTFGETG